MFHKYGKVINLSDDMTNSAFSISLEVCIVSYFLCVLELFIKYGCRFVFSFVNIFMK
jgi:hypothetical protein